MRHLFLPVAIVALALVFQSCTPAKQYYQPLTKRPVQPWKGNSGSWGGYTEESAGKNQLKVAFETFNRPGPEFAAYFVKVRAAEIALARGKDTFWIRDMRTRRWTEKSHFPGYVVPGHWDYHEREVIHCTHHCEAGCRAHIDIVRERYWVPDRYVPPHTSVNLLGKAELVMSEKPAGTRVRATQVIADALGGSHGFGKPRLSKQTLNAYRARLSSAAP